MSFEAEVAAFAAGTILKADAIAGRAVVETGRRLIDRSPVATGNFRANWQLGIDVAPRGVVATRGTRQTPAPPPEIPEIPASDKGRRFYWVNNLSFAVRLDIGLDGGRPLGLTAMAELEWTTVVAKSAA